MKECKWKNHPTFVVIGLRILYFCKLPSGDLVGVSIEQKKGKREDMGKLMQQGEREKKGLTFGLIDEFQLYWPL